DDSSDDSHRIGINLHAMDAGYRAYLGRNDHHGVNRRMYVLLRKQVLTGGRLAMFGGLYLIFAAGLAIIGVR
ncbi:hypothetical protein QN360_17855, partial [Glaciimonas sp. CA11.2]|uniref:hypothetical protein n=1 Tax=Glaciimonas sp. CA11.2 TaxID=3048601 RepID=UPI002B23DD13